ncbi:TIGR00341 family protein, partial [Hyphomonas sp.]|uniref:TIGR00341 family protein n=1 Tax=Hyphomonas sp. TaxID=87 RepID=UPI00391C93DE
MSTTETARRTRPPEWRRRLRVARWRGIRQIQHEEVVAHVHEEGALSGRYIFMTVMSCGIAILGLLLSSPAVIIGAMLISPLMGPIMLMGFSLAILELAALRQAVVSLAVGTLVALVTAFLIVFFSPLTEITSEILARARPNFFDLLVAIFSGLAGGYAVIHRKGETIVGVAIATALMPPLAVTGFGLATAQFQIAGGAFFLFMTNLLAIALMVTVLSRFYGFGERHSPRHTAWQNTLIVGVFVALSIPLGLSLRDIAYEARVRDVARDMLLEPFDHAEARVTDFDVSFPRSGPSRINVRATVLTPERVTGAEAGLSARLSERFRRQVTVMIDQLIVDDDTGSESARLAAVAESSFGAPMRAQTVQLEALAAERRTERELRTAFPYELAAADIDPANRRAVFSAAQTPGVSLPAFRRLEEGLSSNFPDWSVRVDPPKTDLPPVAFAAESADMGEVRTQLA